MLFSIFKAIDKSSSGWFALLPPTSDHVMIQLGGYLVSFELEIKTVNYVGTHNRPACAQGPYLSHPDHFSDS